MSFFVGEFGQLEAQLNYVWDTNLLDWVAMTQPGGGAGGGGAVTVADGADVTLGAKADAAWSGTGSGSVVAILKAAYALLAGTLKVDGSGVTQPVSGTFWQSTQPVSIATMPSTPVTGTFWQSTQPVSIATMPSTPVTGTFWQTTQPVSATSLPLPSNAAQETGGNLATIATNTSGIATAGNQTTGNSSLSTIATNTTGVATASNQTSELAYLATILNNQAEYETNLLRSLVMELRILNAQVKDGLNLRDELDTYRIDPYFNTVVN